MTAQELENYDELDMELRQVPGTIYVRPMIELIEPDNEWPGGDAAKWPIPFATHEIPK